MSSEKAQFASRLGLLAATVGSAVGLGNIWRFPAEAQANGGAAFLIVYIVCIFMLGIPVMLAEFSLGRAGRSDAIGAFKHTGAAKPWWSVGALSIITSFLILCFYMVVAGWSLEYFVQSVTGSLYEGVSQAVAAGDNAALNRQFASHMNDFIGSSVMPVVYTVIVIAINMVVLTAGVQKGIERISNILMPMLFVILIALCCVALSMPKADEGLAFFFNPDFSKITPKVVLNALGQAFFSLSLGMGVLITYAAYYPADTRLGKTAVTVSVLDLFVSVLMGMIIFPAVMSFGLDGESFKGTALVFITLPEVFAQLSGTQLWSALFFLLLFVAAVTSTISIAEVPVSFVHDRFKLARWKAVLIVLVPLMVCAAISSLSLGIWSNFTVFGMTIFDMLDYVTANIFLPIVSLGICLYVGWFANKSLLQSQLTNDHTLRASWAPAATAVIRYIAPVLIILVLISSFL